MRWELKVETLQLLKRPPAEEQPLQWVSAVAGAATVLQSPTALGLLHFISSADRFPSAGAEFSRLSELQLSKLPDRKILKIQKILKEKQSLNKIQRAQNNDIIPMHTAFTLLWNALKRCTKTIIQHLKDSRSVCSDWRSTTITGRFRGQDISFP